MKYKVRISLLDENDKSLVSTVCDEKWVHDLSEFHNDLNPLMEILKVMKLQHETGLTVEIPQTMIGEYAIEHGISLENAREILERHARGEIDAF